MNPENMLPARDRFQKEDLRRSKSTYENVVLSFSGYDKVNRY